MAKKSKKAIDVKSYKSIDLEKLFKEKELKDGEERKAIDELFDYDKKLPAGVLFGARFDPVENWKIGLQGFNIHGLERSKTVTTAGDVALTRNETICMIKTLLKPGDADLGDVKLFILQEKAEA